MTEAEEARRAGTATLEQLSGDPAPAHSPDTLLASGLRVYINGVLIETVVSFDTGEHWVTHHTQHPDGTWELVTTVAPPGAVTVSCWLLRKPFVPPPPFP